MAQIENFQQLEVWQKAHQLALEYVTDIEQLVTDADMISRMLYRLIESIGS